MTSIMFALILGVLAGIAAFGGATSLEMVLMLGVLGLAHMTDIAAREAPEAVRSHGDRSRG